MLFNWKQVTSVMLCGRETSPDTVATTVAVRLASASSFMAESVTLATRMQNTAVQSMPTASKRVAVHVPLMHKSSQQHMLTVPTTHRKASDRRRSSPLVLAEKRIDSKYDGVVPIRV